MLSCLTTLFAVAQETATIGGLKYYLLNGEATVMAAQTETLSGDIIIPETVTYNNAKYRVVRIAESAFAQQNVTSVTLPNSVIELGERCFWNCNWLKTVTLSEGITELPDYCFDSCYRFESIIIPENVTKLGKSCFESCQELESIILPSNITELGESCFSYSNLKSITIPEGVTELPVNLFNLCSNLTSVTLPNSITKIGDKCFIYCDNLESITLPSNITELGESCFSGCRQLKSILLPNSITVLRSLSFENCASLLSVTCQWDNLDGITAAADAFDGIFSEAKLNVPAGTTAIYQTTEPWSNFKYIVEDGTVKPAEKCATPEISYEEKQIIFTCPTEGAQYHYTITAADATEGGYSEDGIIDLTAAYEISVYASAAGYTNSDVATGTLYFTNAEDITVNVAAIDGDQRGLLVTTRGGLMTVSGLADGETATLYNAQGMMIASGKATAGSVSLDTNGTKGVVILKAGNESLKVNIK